MKLTRLSIAFLVLLAACRGAENKADTNNTGNQGSDTDVSRTAQPVNADTSNRNAAPAPSQAGNNSARTSTPSLEPAEILAQIDKYLVSAAQCPASPNGGIANCTISIVNTLPDVTFQKAMLEVTIQNEDGSTVKTDYYPVINIEPQMTKVVKIPNTTTGVKVVSKIVKVKSTELTKGEFVLSGAHYGPK